MTSQHLVVAVSVLTFVVGSDLATAGSAVEEAGAIACFTDKWNEKEESKGHKLADFAGRCIIVPDNPSAAKYFEDCVAKYEYLPDSSWKGNGTCTWTLGGEKVYESFEEGSHLKEYIYKITGGTGKYQGASGGGTYTFENLNDTLGGGRFKGTMQLP